MPTLRSIVVPVDFSTPAAAAAARAGQLAKQTGARLHVLHAARFPLPDLSHEFAVPPLAWETLRAAAAKEVGRVASKLRALGVEVDEEVSDREPMNAIHRAAEDCDADLVVMGTHGHGGVRRYILGSVAESVIRTSRCPVLAVKENEERAAREIRRLVVATDFSGGAARATDFAVEIARDLGARIDLIHVFSIPAHHFSPYGVAPSDSLVQELLDSARSALARSEESVRSRGVEVESHLLTAAASHAIADFAAERDADAIVMGTRGNTGLRHIFLGSVAERTLRLSPCSVLVVPGEEEEPHEDS